MGGQVWLGLIAVSIGVFVGVVLFVPFVFVSYRRRGRVTLRRTLLWLCALVYFWAIWVYTLLPLPEPQAVRCAGVNLNPLTAVDDLTSALAGPGSVLTDPAMLQLALNVALFVPLGFFVRVLGGRGWLVAVIVGFAASLLVELTQLTGVWGLYPCAYRVFDVDDLITNTTGALLGSWLALIVPARLRGIRRAEDADSPRPVTRGRRVLVALCDGLGALIAQFIIAVVMQLVLLLAGRRDLMAAGDVSEIVSTLTVAVLLLLLVLTTGQTIGDLAVEVRYAGGPLPTWLAGVLRYLGGIGGFVLLQLLPAPWSLLSWVFGIVSVVLLFTTEHGRGLPGVVSGTRIVDSRSGSRSDV